MAAFGAGAFSSDKAVEFLKELAEETPERRAAALERLFRSVEDGPELLVGRNSLPDQVVAAAAIVAATSIGGDQFIPG